MYRDPLTGPIVHERTPSTGSIPLANEYIKGNNNKALNKCLLLAMHEVYYCM